MAKYTDISIDTCNQILSLYGLSKAHQIEGISYGISNSNYKVITKDKFLNLKVSNDKNIEQLQQEMSLLKWLNDNLFIYSLRPYQLTSGQYVYKLPSGLFGCLFPFVDGKVPPINSSTCDELGKTLARLHNKTPEDMASIRQHQTVGFGATEIVNYLESENCPTDFKELFLKTFPDHLKGFLSEDFKRGIIHGDFYYDNSLFSNNYLKTMLDFEQSGIGPFILDIGISISGSCLIKGQIGPDLIKFFIEGYQSQRKLEANELKYLDTAIKVGLFSISLWRIKRFKEGDLDPSKEDSYRELILRAASFDSNSAV